MLLKTTPYTFKFWLYLVTYYTSFPLTRCLSFTLVECCFMVLIPLFEKCFSPKNAHIYFLLLQQKHVIVPMLQNISLSSIGNSAPPDTAVQNTEVIAQTDICNYSTFICSRRGDLLKCLVTDKKHWHGLVRSCIQYICWFKLLLCHFISPVSLKTFTKNYV